MTDIATTTYPAMDPEVKAKWLEALRSGDYTQGNGYLQDKNGCNCCLGVLAKINEAPIVGRSEIGAVRFGFNPNYNSIYQPPDDYCGLGNKTIVHLMHLNDGTMEGAGGPTSFEGIADWIESNI